MTVDELARQTVAATIKMGVSELSAWSEYQRTLIPIVKAHETGGKYEFDRDIMTKYVRSVEERSERGEIKPSYYRALIRGAQKLTEIHDTGEFNWTTPKLTTRFKLNGYYQGIVDEFLAGNFSIKGRSDAMWVARKYFAWLITQGHDDLMSVGAVCVQQFMIFCSKSMKSTSVHNIKLYMKKLYNFLAAHGYSSENFEGLLSFKVSRESRLYPATPPDEVSTILDVIDRHTPKGKRDYAIILLGVVAGLRACDITRMRLSDISWTTGEIKLVQAKTGRTLILPLTTDLGEALQDYILNGRQETDSNAVFLRLHVPFKGFTNGVAIEDLYNEYRKKANLPRNANDGKGFHSLRRGLGKNLVTADVSVETAAQVLGDKNIDSMKKYVALDSHHLRECALDFSGIGQEEHI